MFWHFRLKKTPHVVIKIFFGRQMAVGLKYGTFLCEEWKIDQLDFFFLQEINFFLGWIIHVSWTILLNLLKMTEILKKIES